VFGAAERFMVQELAFKKHSIYIFSI